MDRASSSCATAAPRAIAGLPDCDADAIPPPCLLVKASLKKPAFDLRSLTSRPELEHVATNIRELYPNGEISRTEGEALQLTLYLRNGCDEMAAQQ
jgi:hypothetical protein